MATDVEQLKRKPEEIHQTLTKALQQRDFKELIQTFDSVREQLSQGEAKNVIWATNKRGNTLSHILYSDFVEELAQTSDKLATAVGESRIAYLKAFLHAEGDRGKEVSSMMSVSKRPNDGGRQLISGKNMLLLKRDLAAVRDGLAEAGAGHTPETMADAREQSTEQSNQLDR